ncbi:hypothetical protein Htur_1516 [Haloterrigena turkmenica DSM 5511]|uniref:Uncharacterized protein n=1 Tax=Haloterrigena turkmenica (strain ATCC 51198 / DSM 5511 / JCM 9101 / NCIMB 13204 / VKM B-1734 / 4k) TaxID=543526 RepID=D2RQS1_HALTV|nr:hypothetical protein [Haloterrigena turkmenica]ADB60402.1 hypothetical protein Htur_1516 [Haloterrigena turkmenica DSM 5511]
MWPLDLYSVSWATGTGTITPLTVGGISLEALETVGSLERAGFLFAGTFVFAAVVLGLLQGYAPRTVTKARRSPVISICVGLPSLLVVVGLGSTGYLILDTDLGPFFGIPMIVFGGTIVPAFTDLGFVALGRSLAARLGCDRLSVGILLGSVLAGVAGLSLALTVVVAGLAGALGIGAGVRVVMATGGTSQPDDRTVPPANKI